MVLRVIDRAWNLRSLLEDPALEKAIGGLEGLPSLPKVHRQIVEILADPSRSLNDAAAVIEGDPALAARSLKIVNSAFFGVRQSVDNVPAAVRLLGAEVVKNLVLSVEIRMAFEAAPRVEGSLAR